MNGHAFYVLLVLGAHTLFAVGCTSKPPPTPNTYFQYQPVSEANYPSKSVAKLSSIIDVSIQKMLTSQNGITANTSVAVADFVTLAADYDRPTLLGRYLGQAYLTALHKAGVTTVDYQITGGIRITPEGNLGLSQDYLELANDVDANTVLVGTITPSQAGYTVHIRMVENASKHVLAADQFFLTKKMVKDSVSVSL